MRTMERLPVACLCLLLSCSAVGSAGSGVDVFEDSDVILPCSLNTKEDIRSEVFVWRKDPQKDVFLYDAGIYYNAGPPGQDEQFKGRIFHFPDELQHGNASIIINKTNVADSGNYTCDFPRLQPPQTSHIELVVAPILKDRSAENIPGAAAKPSVKTLYQTNHQALLQCEVQGASPKPEVEWRDSSGNILHAEEPLVTKTGKYFNIIVTTTVTKTDTYRCVATQEEINHQTEADTYVYISVSRVVVFEDSDVILPCSLNTKEDIRSEVFDWRKDPLKEVFLYDAGSHYDNGRTGQHEQFRGRVSHFPDELQHGDASIIIRKTKLDDSGNYTCIFPHLQPPQTSHIELVVGSAGSRVVVEEGSDAILPCSLNTKENITSKLFDWKKDPQGKDGQKEVFLYSDGSYYDKGFSGQDKQFEGRVFHFPDELQHGNASIIIRKTQVVDSGKYTCIFPILQPEQPSHIELVVGAAAKPSVKILHQTNDQALLQCEVKGASPEPKVEWRDSSGNILPAEEPLVSEREGRFNITIKTTVTKNDTYHCVATQKEINHEAKDHTYVYFSELNSGARHGSESSSGWVVPVVVTFFVTVLLGVVLLLALRHMKRHRKQKSNKTSQELQEMDSL